MIRQYKHKAKTYYLIQLSITESNGKRHQPKFRFTKQGQRITSERMAKTLEFEYQNEFQAELEGKILSMTFTQWHQKFLSNIKLSFKRGTIMMYDGDLIKWLPENFKIKKLTEITKTDIHHLIFDYLIKEGASPNIQQKTRRVLSRIFEAALEEGHISRNPCEGISVKVPPPERKVLNSKEVDILLTAAKNTDHHFYHIWAFSLFSGLRNGELYSLRWKHIDEVTGNITVLPLISLPCEFR